MKCFAKNWLPVLLWAGLIFYLSSLPNLRTEFGGSWDLVIRKCAHAAEYAVLAWLISRAIMPTPRNYRLRYLVVIIIATTYAISDEWHQSLVVGRTGTIYDVMIDTSGVLVGVLLHGWIMFRTKPST